MNQVIPVYRFPDIYSNVFVCPVFHTHLLGRYSNACNATDNHNRMQQSNIAVDNYWVKQSGYFRLATIVPFCMGITDGNILFCHGILEESVDNKTSTKDYNNRTVYDCFNNIFTANFFSDLNLPHITIDYRP